MNPINPWLDPIEVRQLAEQLLRPDRGSALDAADTGFDEEFVGFANARSAPQPETPLPPVPDPTTAEGQFLARILQLRDWLHRQYSASGMFLLDHEGALVFDESSHGRLHLLARSVALASRKQGSAAGNVHVKIGADAILEIIPVETARGWLVLGAVVPATLSPPAVAAVMDALAQVASDGTASES
jgi:hypothetical protein